MAYAAQLDLVPLRLTQEELVELTDDAGTNAVNASIVSAALEEASGRVESYCRQRYQTPLQPGDDVKALTVDIAIYILFSRRRNARPNEIIRQRFDDAINFLKDLASGKASLDQPTTLPAQNASSGQTLVSCRPQRFNDRNLDGYTGNAYENDMGWGPGGYPR